MTWSYNIGSGLAKDMVRLHIGDTREDDPQLQDEEIAIFVAGNPTNAMAVAAACCTALAARYARDVTRSLGQASISASDRMKAYQELAKDLAQRALSYNGACTPMEVGGITTTEHDSLRSQTGLVQPAYTRGMYDMPGNGDGGGSR